ncbi:MAG TPA: tetratricopeptide repeat protein [Kofleriaceae bacterium]|nr:tetratricopeptide repeat protein [Kofleriaceae bacterium]
MKSAPHRVALGALVFLVLFALGAGSAAAQKKSGGDKPSAADMEKAKQHFAKGKELFDLKDLKGAVTEFKESYRLSKNGLLLYNIGYTLDQLGDKSLALFYYQKYLTDAPKSDGNRATAKTRADALAKEIEEATLSGEPTTTPEPTPEPTPTPTETEPPAPTGPVDKFMHNIIDEAPPGKPIDVSAFIPPGKGWRVLLLYRAAGESKFTVVEMKPRYNEMIGRIPAAKTVGTNVQYYIEVRDKAGKVVDRSGKQTSPHLVFLDKAAKPRFYADLGDETATPIAEEDTEIAGGAMLGQGATNEPEARGDGWFDAGSSKFSKLKWGATITAGSALALSMTFYYLSGKAGSDLESEADASKTGAECGGSPPCRTFSDKQQSLEGRGERFETFGTVTLAVGGVAAIGAGVLWWLERREHKKRRAAGPDENPLSAIPVVNSDYVGGAAAVRF